MAQLQLQPLLHHPRLHQQVFFTTPQSGFASSAGQGETQHTDWFSVGRRVTSLSICSCGKRRLAPSQHPYVWTFPEGGGALDASLSEHCFTTECSTFGRVEGSGAGVPQREAFHLQRLEHSGTSWNIPNRTLLSKSADGLLRGFAGHQQ